MLMPCGPRRSTDRRQPAVITFELLTNRKLSDDEVSPHCISEKPVCRPTEGKRISKPEADVAWQVNSMRQPKEWGKVVGQQCPNTMCGEHPLLLASNDTLAFHNVHIAIRGKLAQPVNVLTRSWPMNL
jgi:hypothetical protein